MIFLIELLNIITMLHLKNKLNTNILNNQSRAI